MFPSDCLPNFPVVSKLCIQVQNSSITRGDGFYYLWFPLRWGGNCWGEGEGTSVLVVFLSIKTRKENKQDKFHLNCRICIHFWKYSGTENLRHTKNKLTNKRTKKTGREKNKEKHTTELLVYFELNMTRFCPLSSFKHLILFSCSVPEYIWIAERFKFNRTEESSP